MIAFARGWARLGSTGSISDYRLSLGGRRLPPTLDRRSRQDNGKIEQAREATFPGIVARARVSTGGFII